MSYSSAAVAALVGAWAAWSATFQARDVFALAAAFLVGLGAVQRTPASKRTVLSTAVWSVAFSHVRRHGEPGHAELVALTSMMVGFVFTVVWISPKSEAFRYGGSQVGSAQGVRPSPPVTTPSEVRGKRELFLRSIS